MILCLDAGNTRVKYGLYDGAKWRQQEAASTATVLADPRAWSEGIRQRLRASPVRVVACCVAGGAMVAVLEALAARLEVPLTWLRSCSQAMGVSNAYATPEQLGNDRWAALLAARQIATGPCVVVMAGTATTIDGLDAQGRFLGGLILPGLSLMRQALAGGTAQLPLAGGRCRHWPDNTDDAITTGCLRATAGAVATIRGQLQTAGSDVACLLSGGAADALQPLLPGPVTTVPELVLEGIARFACADRG